MQIAKEKLLCPRGGDHPLQDVEHFFVRLQGLHLIYGSLLLEDDAAERIVFRSADARCAAPWKSIGVGYVVSDSEQV